MCRSEARRSSTSSRSWAKSNRIATMVGPWRRVLEPAARDWTARRRRSVARAHRRGERVELVEVGAGREGGGRREVLLEVGDALGARDRHDELALREHPRQRDLAGLDAVAVGYPA